MVSSGSQTLPATAANQHGLLGGVLQDRVIGTIFGSALGDAIGLYTEFLSTSESLASYPERKFSLVPPAGPTPFRRDSHRAPNHPGDWTDDTDQALCILLSYLHKDGQLDAQDFAHRLETWVHQGLRALDTLPLGLGYTVGAIVKDGDFHSKPEAVARKFWKSREYRPAPNGSLMRTHPLGVVCLHKTVEETFTIAAEFSEVTHVDPRCIVACAIGTALVRGLVRGEIHQESHIDDLVSAAGDWFEERQLEALKVNPNRAGEPHLDRAELLQHVRAERLEDLALDEAQKIGYVYKTLGSGILLLRQAFRIELASGGKLSAQLDMFETLITDLIMFGGDADTNACFAGALLGAHLGYKALPAHWKEGMTYGKWLMTKSEAVCQILGVVGGDYKGSQDKDTADDGGRGYLNDEQMDQRWKAHVDRIVKEKKEYENRQRQAAAGTWKGNRLATAFGLSS